MTSVVINQWLKIPRLGGTYALIALGAAFAFFLVHEVVGLIRYLVDEEGLHFLVDVFFVFAFILWFWLLMMVATDLFRRHDFSGWVKTLWVIAIVVAPYIGVFAYLIFQGRGMTVRSARQAQEAREELRRIVGFSAADEIEKLDRLKKAGSISDAEFTRLRAKLVQ
jgi:hypothetical protein